MEPNDALFLLEQADRCHRIAKHLGQVHAPELHDIAVTLEERARELAGLSHEKIVAAALAPVPALD